jgi:hypothetical protein
MSTACDYVYATIYEIDVDFQSGCGKNELSEKEQ